MEAIRAPADEEAQLAEAPPPKSVEADGAREDLGHEQPGSEWQHRRWFVVRVLGVNLLQLCFTAGIFRLMYIIRPLRELAGMPAIFLCYIFVLVGVAAYNGLSLDRTTFTRRNHPWNIAALLAVTVGTAIGVGFLCSFASSGDHAGSFIHFPTSMEATTALAASASFVIALTSPVKFTRCGVFLGQYAHLVAILISLAVNNSSPQDGSRWIVAALFGVAAIILCCGLVHSFQVLIGSGPFERHRRQPLDREDWDETCCSIYFQIIIIFSAITPALLYVI